MRAAIRTALVSLGVLAFSFVSAPPGHAATHDNVESSVVRAVNVQRHAHGLPSVRVNRRLAGLADSYNITQFNAGQMSHGLRGNSGSRIKARLGNVATGEVLAWATNGSPRNGSFVVNLWMHSPPHRAVLMSRGLHRVGVGQRTGTLNGASGTLYTADFAS